MSGLGPRMNLITLHHWVPSPPSVKHLDRTKDYNVILALA
jgi:hypothetical protein